MSSQAIQDWEPRAISPDDLPLGSEFYRGLLDNLYDGVYFVDTHRQILYWNHGAERLTGYAAEQVVGRCCYANILNDVDESGRPLCKTGCPLVHAIETATPIFKRVFLRHKDGRRIAVDVHVLPLRSDRGEIIGAVEVFRDASSVVALETAYAKLHELAERDPLTGLANRRCLDQVLDGQVELFKRTGIPFSIILADIDHFKQINDTLGHPAGDKALTSFAGWLKKTCRRSDIVGRWGGDEFLMILPEQGLEHAVGKAKRLQTAVAHSAPEEIRNLGMTGSFGATEVVLGDTVASILQRADEALYQAKSLGRNRVEAVSGN